MHDAWRHHRRSLRYNCGLPYRLPAKNVKVNLPVSAGFDAENATDES
jgi:hypothetical protein